MNRTRSENAAINISVTIAIQIIKNVLAFVGRTVFIYTLGMEYLGVNSLFSDILSVLSFAELGIGSALNFSLYKPLSDNNIEKIKSIMNLYKNSYRVIGFAVGLLGLSVIPFLGYVVGDVSYVKENLILIYLLFLLNSVISYFFVYKQSLIIADQKSYIVNIYQQIMHCLLILFQSIFLIVTKALLPYLFLMLICTALTNVILARKADSLYPYLKDKMIKRLDKHEVGEIKTNVKALFSYKIGAILIESTDSIFISAFSSVETVGLYANYKMIIYMLRSIIGQITNSIVASVGNLNASNSTKKKENVFDELMYLGIWIFGFFSTGLVWFITPFIELWLGEECVISFGAVIAACMYFYITGAHLPCYMYRNTAGMFVYGKCVPLCAALVNIVLDIAMGYKWGLTGILWASVLCKLFTYNLVDPIIIFRHIFNKSLLKYFFEYFCLTALVFTDGFISYKVSCCVSVGGVAGFALRVAAFSLVYNIIYIAFTFRKPSFLLVKSRVNVLMSKVVGQIKH